MSYFLDEVQSLWQGHTARVAVLKHSLFPEFFDIPGTERGGFCPLSLNLGLGLLGQENTAEATPCQFLWWAAWSWQPPLPVSWDVALGTQSPFCEEACVEGLHGEELRPRPSVPAKPLPPASTPSSAMK